MEKKYCGIGKNIKTSYGNIMKLSFTETDVKMLAENLDNGWVNVKLLERKEPSEKGTTHYMVVDDWKPEKKTTPNSDIDLPF